MKKSVQDSLLEAIDIIVGEKLSKTSYTSSHVGKVKKVNGFDCTVEVYGSDTECKLLEHMHTQIKVGDIVVVQDLYNDNTHKFVQCKIGETT
ncbi:hypothetical protein [Bacillus gaemokensis]|uniref:Uncharacterized protein n=1 Tax=Bacillus gaemokensis TaxID=574375 RepID=A0A073K9J9_9BACI|nr:hypothetical protein [Bacillus gaemokensis]KEK23934.1 hypothetical protein BAGA_05815 [Bacillus gaemokensis]KYG38057.1 hypothetical protein AZF08_20060 [Bacillus gaemokensis]